MDPILEIKQQLDAERQAEWVLEDPWRAQMPQKAYEESAYRHLCPMCRGYLERRGDFFTCQRCPYEYPPNGEKTATIPVFALAVSEFFHYAGDELTQYLLEQQQAGLSMYVALRRPATLELRGGKIPVPGAVPYDVSSEGVSMYKYLELGWNPETNSRQGANPENIQGAPEQRGVYAEFPANRRAEVTDFDASLAWANIIVPLNYSDGFDARLHTHQGEGWVSFSDLRPIYPTRSPYRKR